MTQRSGREPDRRQHARIEPKGTVTLYALGNWHRGRLVNIGAGGLHVATKIGVPDQIIGRVVDLELRFDGPLAVWQRLAGRASHAAARVISPVLIDADAARRATIAGAFRATGCEVVEAATSLEAIARLGESHFEPTSSRSLIRKRGRRRTKCAPLSSASTRTRCSSTIGHELLGPAGLANWLSSATSADLPARIRGLLFAPRSAGDDSGGEHV